MSWLQLLFDFRGRIDRKQYWLGVALAHLGARAIGYVGALALLGGFMLSGRQLHDGHAFAGALTFLGLTNMAGFAAVYCTVVLAAKRMRHTGIRGRWSLALLPFLLAASPLAVSASTAEWILAGQSVAPGSAAIGVFCAVIAVSAVIAIGCVSLRNPIRGWTPYSQNANAV